MKKITALTIVSLIHAVLCLTIHAEARSAGSDSASVALADMSPGVAAQADRGPQSASISDNLIKGRLAAGLRSSYQILTDDDSGHRGGTSGSGTFLGTIYALDESQNSAPIRPFISYDISKYFSLELAYDYQKAKTLSASGTVDKSDGDIIMQGPTLSVLGRYPNPTAFTPYLGAGIGFYSADFDESAHWALGYPNEVTYTSLGSPSTLFNGRSRYMDMDSAAVLLISAGTACALSPSWFLDLSVQYFRQDIDATFYGYTNGVLDTEVRGSFPMDNLSLRVGIGYRF